MLCWPRCCRCHLKSWKGSDRIESRSIAAIAILAVASLLSRTIPNFSSDDIQTFRAEAHLDFVLSSFLPWDIWTRAQDLRLSVVMGLRRGLSLIRGMPRALTEDEQHKVADAIVEHLQHNNWKIEQGPPREGHGQHLMK
jgi:hypothetical protein